LQTDCAYHVKLKMVFLGIIKKCVMMKFENEFKAAISNLPSKEKDKLILRLLKHDVALASRLHFELVDVRSVEELRDALEKKLIQNVNNYGSKNIKPDYFALDLKSLSGEINEHVYTTKDKYGEISLNLTMMVEALKATNINFKKHSYQNQYKFMMYIIQRIFKILILMTKLDPDYLIEFRDKMKELGFLMGENINMMHLAINNGLDVNWLLSQEIPEDIELIQKELKQNGFLK
jgi:hypothetical protein